MLQTEGEPHAVEFAAGAKFLCQHGVSPLGLLNGLGHGLHGLLEEPEFGVRGREGVEGLGSFVVRRLARLLRQPQRSSTVTVAVIVSL